MLVTWPRSSNPYVQPFPAVVRFPAVVVYPAIVRFPAASYVYVVTRWKGVPELESPPGSSDRMLVSASSIEVVSRPFV